MTALAAVIPLHGKETRAERAQEDTAPPEPVQLYGLICLAFFLHVDQDGRCARCPEPWPCDHLRLAYRLREGF